jgi:hypothetical protein
MVDKEKFNVMKSLSMSDQAKINKACMADAKLNENQNAG